MTLSTSVVIPCYNVQDYLPEALNSVAAQTLPVREIILVDDGSRIPIEKPASWEGPPLTILRTGNRGLAAARNLGIQHGHGDLIAFLDADDLWHPRKVEVQTSILEAKPDAVACYSQCLTKPGFFGFGPYPPVEVTSKEFLLVMWHSLFFPPSAVVVRRPTLVEVGCFRENLGNGEDIELWLRLLTRGRIEQAAEPLTEYRQHDQQFTKNVARKMFGTKNARRTMIQQHSTMLIEAGIPQGKLWDAYRNDILLVYYRREFGAARRLLWDYWLEHPGDLGILKSALISLLPSSLVRACRGDLNGSSGPGSSHTSSHASWENELRSIHRVLGR